MKFFKSAFLISIVFFLIGFSQSYATGESTLTIGSTYPKDGLSSGNTPGFSSSIIDGIAIDTSGNTYVADGSNGNIIKYDTHGDKVWIKNIGGYPQSIRVDGSGNIYVIQKNNYRVQKYDNSGNLLLTIGGGASGTSTGSNNLSGTSALFNYPSSIALKSDGTIIYVADRYNNRIAQYLTSNGTYNGLNSFTSPLALQVKGNYMFAYSYLGTASNNIKVFNIPTGLVTPLYTILQNSNLYTDIGMDSDGTYLYITTGAGSPNILKYQLSNGAGVSNNSYNSGNNMYLKGLACYNGLFFSVDDNTHRVRVFSSPPTELYTYYTTAYGNNSLGGTSSQMGGVYSTTVDLNGNIFVYDNTNSVIRKFDSAGTFITSTSFVAGMYGMMDTDSSGNLYIVEYSNNRIVRYANNLTGKTTIIGSPTGALGDNVLNGTAHLLKTPFGIAVKNNYIYVADRNNCKVKKFDMSGNYVFAIGNGTCSETASTLYYPTGVGVDSLGNVYISQPMYHNIRKFDNDGTYLNTIGSASHTPGLNTLGGTSALFYLPYGITVDNLDNLIISDNSNGGIKRINSIGNFSYNFGYNTSMYGNPVNAGIDKLGNIYFPTGNINRILKMNGGYFASCKTNNPINSVVYEGSPTSLNQTLVKDDTATQTCSYSCSNGYTGDSCEIAPEPVCDTQPTYIHAIYNTGATSYLQDWIKDDTGNSTCSFKCSDGYTGDSCEIAPFCASTPNIENATFNTGSANVANQEWIKGSESCGYICVSGFSGNDCSEKLSITVSEEVKMNKIENKAFVVDTSKTTADNVGYIDGDFKEISSGTGGSIKVENATTPDITPEDKVKLEKVLNVIDNNSEKIAKTETRNSLGFIEDSSKGVTILTMNSATYNKYPSIIDMIENLMSKDVIIVNGAKFTKFIDPVKGIIIYYKVK